MDELISKNVVVDVAGGLDDSEGENPTKQPKLQRGLPRRRAGRRC